MLVPKRHKLFYGNCHSLKEKAFKNKTAGHSIDGMVILHISVPYAMSIN
jgi:hypothetical protein